MSRSESVVDDNSAGVARASVETVADDQGDESDAPVERRQVRPVQHARYRVVAQRSPHRCRQRAARPRRLRRALAGGQEASEFDERRGADDAALEQRGEQLDVIFVSAAEPVCTQVGCPFSAGRLSASHERESFQALQR